MKNIKRIFLMCSVLSFIACNAQENENTTKENIKKEVSETMEKVKAYSVEEKNEILQQYKSKRDQTKTQITELREKLSDLKDDKMLAAKEKVSDLENRQEKFEKKINELQTSSEDAYQRIKIGIENAMSELDNAIKAANKEFN